jgi:C4-dicarboxylate-specific signal transduction histidine kinase
MGSDREEVLRQKQLAFVGKVLASLADKLQSQVTGIKEANGRLSALLDQEGPQTPEDEERFARVLSTIERHLEILAKKNEQLGRFSQRTVHPFSSFKAKELVEEAVSFSTRLAHVRGISFEQEISETLPDLHSDPVKVHFLISILIHSMLERLPRDGKVTLRADSVEEGVRIEVEGHGTLETTVSSSPHIEAPHWPVVESVVGDLGGRLDVNAMADDFRTALFLPKGEGPDVA